jgi:hypothetical protein
MLCEHLLNLEAAISASGAKETYRGQAWSDNCRLWVYFDCYLDNSAIRRQFELPAFVVDHINDDSHSGRESGLVCSVCHDAIVGVHPEDAAGRRVFPHSSESLG